METKRGGVPLSVWMLLGFVVGLGGGLYVNLNGLVIAPWIMDSIQSVGQIFLRLLFMLVLPLLFSALAIGVAEMGDLKSLGRAGIKTLLFTIVVSAIAVGKKRSRCNAIAANRVCRCAIGRKRQCRRPNRPHARHRNTRCRQRLR